MPDATVDVSNMQFKLLGNTHQRFKNDKNA